MATLTSGAGGNVSINTLAGGASLESYEITIATAKQVRFQFDLGDGVTRTWDLSGTGFTYDDFGDPAGGTVTRWREIIEDGQRVEWSPAEQLEASGAATHTGPDITGGTRFDIKDFSLEMGDFMSWATMGSGELDLLKDRLFAGNDVMTGGSRDWTVQLHYLDMDFEYEVGDQLRGYGGNDTLNGSGGFDYLMGDAGNDILNGGAGFDILDGGAGRDRMSGGADNDWYYVDSTFDVVKETTNGGESDQVSASISYALPENVEYLGLTGSKNINGTGNELANWIIGNSGRNALSGGAGNDNLSGGEGNDALTGGAGNDTLDGGAGNDKMAGGAGNDTYWVDSHADVLTEAAGAGTDTVQSFLDFTLDANMENLTILSAEGAEGVGNARGNVINGGDGDDVLAGLGGNDTLTDGWGDDVLLGGAGKDSLDGGAGDDLLVGGAGDDTLSGNYGDDTLKGGAGSDHLGGAEGSDTLLWDPADALVDGGSDQNDFHSPVVDTLKVGGSGAALDLTQIDNSKIANIEAIRFTGSNTSLTLNLEEVLAISSTTDVLKVDGVFGYVTAHDAGMWSHNGTTQMEGNSYNVFIQQAAALWVDTDLMTNIPTVF